MALSFVWKVWAVTLPRSLAAEGNVASPSELVGTKAFRSHGYDGIAEACAGAMPTYDEDLEGFPQASVSQGLVDCSFLTRLPTLLLQHGADPTVTNKQGHGPFREAHPSVIASLASSNALSPDVHSTLAASSDHHSDQWSESGALAHWLASLGGSKGTAELETLGAGGDECDVKV